MSTLCLRKEMGPKTVQCKKKSPGYSEILHSMKKNLAEQEADHRRQSAMNKEFIQLEH